MSITGLDVSQVSSTPNAPAQRPDASACRRSVLGCSACAYAARLPCCPRVCRGAFRVVRVGGWCVVHTRTHTHARALCHTHTHTHTHAHTHDLHPCHHHLLLPPPTSSTCHKNLHPYPTPRRSGRSISCSYRVKHRRNARRPWCSTLEALLHRRQVLFFAQVPHLFCFRIEINTPFVSVSSNNLTSDE